jgi:hypothetical protein
VLPEASEEFGDGVFWERMIIHDADYTAHVDYCHINPLKYGLVVGFIRHFTGIWRRGFIQLTGYFNTLA